MVVIRDKYWPALQDQSPFYLSILVKVDRYNQTMGTIIQGNLNR